MWVILTTQARRDTGSNRAGLATRQDGVVAIPKTSKPEHVEENRDALNVRPTEDDLATLLRRHARTS